MKNTLIILSIILNTLYANAQEPVQNQNYHHYADSVILYLDKTKITYWVIYDKTQPLAYLNMFEPKNNIVISSSVHFIQAIHELYYRHFNQENQISSENLLTGL